MGDIPGPSSSPPLSPNSNLPMLYYGLVVVGTATIVLTLYNLFIVQWCTRRPDESRRIPARTADMTTSQSFENQSRNLLSSFKYKKEKGNMESQDPDGGYQCAVCLSVFEDGEEVRQLPRCKHSFHAPCIDMWLFSRFDCPLCRAPVDLCPVLTSTNGA